MHVQERKFIHCAIVDAVERLHSIVKSETAWEPAYSSVNGADETRVPECTEGFMVVIKGIEGWAQLGKIWSCKKE